MKIGQIVLHWVCIEKDQIFLLNVYATSSKTIIWLKSCEFALKSDI